ncbi:MAG: VOC family protein, partial [Rhodococcus fascians]
MTLTPVMITIDSSDPGPLATWWAARTGGTIEEDNDGWFYTVSLPSAPYRLAFQKVDDPTPGKNKVHLDVHTDGDLDAEVDRWVAAGATSLGTRSAGDFSWV